MNKTRYSFASGHNSLTNLAINLKAVEAMEAVETMEDVEAMDLKAVEAPEALPMESTVQTRNEKEWLWNQMQARRICWSVAPWDTMIFWFCVLCHGPHSRRGLGIPDKK